MPKTANEYLNHGIDLYHKGDHQGAIKELNEAIALNPRYGYAYNALGVVFANLNDNEKAIENYTKSIEFDLYREPKSNRYEAYFNRGLAYIDLEQLKKAEADFLKAISLNSQRPNAYNMLGYIYSSQEKNDEALEIFNKAIECDPKYKFPYIHSGALYFKLKKFDEAIEILNKGIPLENTHAKAYVYCYFFLGLINYELEKYDEAKSNFSKIENLPVSDVIQHIDTKTLSLGDTALHIAVRFQDEKLAKLLVEKTIDQLIKNNDGLTAMELACQLNDGKMAPQLITARKTSKDISYPDCETTLISAIQNQHYVIVEALLNINTSCDKWDVVKGNVAIYETLVNDNIKILLLLLEKLDINNIKFNRDGNSVIDIARKLGAINCYKYLLQHNALKEMQQEMPKKPLFFSRASHLESIDNDLKSLNWQAAEQNDSKVLNVQDAQQNNSRILNVQNAEQVENVFNEIESQLNNLNATTKTLEPFEKKFYEKFKLIRRQITNISFSFTNSVEQTNQTNSLFPTNNFVATNNLPATNNTSYLMTQMPRSTRTREVTDVNMPTPTVMTATTIPLSDAAFQFQLNTGVQSQLTPTLEPVYKTAHKHHSHPLLFGALPLKKMDGLGIQPVNAPVATRKL